MHVKIAYFVNSFNAINWGGQATSNGIKYLIETTYKNAIFVPFTLPTAPFKKIKLIGKLLDVKIYNALMDDDKDALMNFLKYYSIDKTYFQGYTHICFNGEGAIHSRSGHFIFLMALLYLAKQQGKYVAAINQTIDLARSPKWEKLIIKIYNNVDFVSVREPASFEYAQELGIQNIHLIPDATYGLPHLSPHEIETRIKSYNLPENYIGITGSSSLVKNTQSLKKVVVVIEAIKKCTNQPLIFLANAKTDIWIAHKLQSKFGYRIIEPPIKYLDAIAIISKANLLIGGRQHPNIFAYEYGVPYIPLSANTRKNEGVAKLQHYPISPIGWNQEGLKKLPNLIQTIRDVPIAFNQVTINDFHIFKKES